MILYLVAQADDEYKHCVIIIIIMYRCSASHFPFAHRHFILPV
jgi:hypothetical protein